MTDATVRYIFLLSALLIVVAYFVGAATETTALAQGIRTLVYAVTGRTDSGSFATYPSGASATSGGTTVKQ